MEIALTLAGLALLISMGWALAAIGRARRLARRRPSGIVIHIARATPHPRRRRAF